MKPKIFKKLFLSGFVLLGVFNNTLIAKAEEIEPVMTEEVIVEDVEIVQEDVNEEQIIEDSSTEEVFEASNEVSETEEIVEDLVVDEVTEDLDKEGVLSNVVTYKLESIVDTSVLADKLAEAKAIDQETLVGNSKAILNSAIIVAESALNDPEEVSVASATNALISAMNGLLIAGDTTELEILVTKAQGVNRQNLILSSQQVLEDAIVQAQGIIESEVALQDKIIEAQQHLQSALDNLQYLDESEDVNVNVLLKTIEKAERINITNKTDYSRVRFLLALDESRKTVNNLNVSQQEVDDLVFKLENAMGKLESLDGSEVVLDEDRLDNQDIIGVPDEIIVENNDENILGNESNNMIAEDNLESDEVLPNTGMGAMGLISYNTMIVAGLSLVLIDKKKK